MCSCACWRNIWNAKYGGNWRRCCIDDTEKEAAEALRQSIVAQAQRSSVTVSKQTTGMTPDGLPVHSFHSLRADLATLTRNTMVTAITPDYPITVLARLTPVQRKAFALLEAVV